MKSKILLNKVTYSIIEKKIKNTSYHKVNSNMVLEFKKKEEIENNLINIAEISDKKNVHTTKIPLGLSNHSNHIKNIYKTNEFIYKAVCTFFISQATVYNFTGVASHSCTT